MDNYANVLRYDEQAIMRLRQLYRQYGYAQYRMSRFEEYELYAGNKAFLTSGDIITFSGAGGKLMALRPDVTLSIVKSVKDEGGIKKLYYNENVYRPDGHEFKERMQVGLECIGRMDIYSMGEVLMLARRSLELLDEHSCLDISHMGFINGLLGDAVLTPEQRANLLGRLSERNTHELASLCTKYGLEASLRDRISSLATLYGSYENTISEMKRISANEETEAALREIEGIHSVLCMFGANRDVNLDFSIVNDLSYYSGIIFQGYIEGIPAKVASGGRYDKLLQKFGKRSGAIGFAVYLDLLERTNPPRKGIKVDVLLTYSADISAEKLAEKVKTLTEEGKSVCVRHENRGDIEYEQLIQVEN